MSKTKKSRPSVAAPGRQTETGTYGRASTSTTYHNTQQTGRQPGKIEHLLSHGAKNAVPLQHLVNLTELPARPVEQVKDLLSIENTRQYNGLYHVLGGVISPMQGIGPSDLKIDLLLDRIARGDVREVILALSTTVEGETTSFYITRRLSSCEGVRVTSIARGIGFGDELDYADELTIAHAIHNRRPI